MTDSPSPEAVKEIVERLTQSAASRIVSDGHTVALLGPDTLLTEAASTIADLSTRLEAAEAERDETGWLIEHPTEPKWWNGDPGPFADPAIWTTDSIEALRFARKRDAETEAHYYFDGECRVTEHMWCAPRKRT